MRLHLFDYRSRMVVAAESGHQVNPLDNLPNLFDQINGQLNTRGSAMIATVTHLLMDLSRNLNSGYLLL